MGSLEYCHKTIYATKRRALFNPSIHSASSAYLSVLCVTTQRAARYAEKPQRRFQLRNYQKKGAVLTHRSTLRPRRTSAFSALQRRGRRDTLRNRREDFKLRNNQKKGGLDTPLPFS